METSRPDQHRRADTPTEHILKIRLSDSEYRALVRHAMAEDRTFSLQAARLIREGLEAAGAYSPGDVTP